MLHWLRRLLVGWCGGKGSRRESWQGLVVRWSWKEVEAGWGRQCKVGRLLLQLGWEWNHKKLCRGDVSGLALAVGLLAELVAVEMLRGVGQICGLC